MHPPALLAFLFCTHDSRQAALTQSDTCVIFEALHTRGLMVTNTNRPRVSRRHIRMPLGHHPGMGHREAENLRRSELGGAGEITEQVADLMLNRRSYRVHPREEGLNCSGRVEARLVVEHGGHLVRQHIAKDGLSENKICTGQTTVKRI